MKVKLIAVCLAVFGLLSGFAATASGDDAELVIGDNDKVLSHECTGDTVVKVVGNENKITLTGDCAKVDVTGNKNAIDIDATVAISVMGNKNAVTWARMIDGKKPKISNLGSKNSISRKK